MLSSVSELSILFFASAAGYFICRVIDLSPGRKYNVKHMT